jgi:hypothetical protein
VLVHVTRAVAAARRLVAALGTLMGHLAGWGFIFCALFITFDVLARRFLGFSTQATTEITGYALAFGISWALSHTLTARRHVRIDVAINHLPARLALRHAPREPCRARRARRLHCLGCLRPRRRVAPVRRDRHQRPAHARSGSARPLGVGIAVFLLLILLMLAEAALLVVSGRGSEAEAQLHARTYDEEAAEALDAVGASTPGIPGR